MVAEQVDEVEFAMDSVFLGPAERLTVRIDFPAAVAPPMVVDDLLSWVRTLASEEGPRIIQDGGRAGARAVVPTLDRLRNLTQSVNGRIRHPGARHPRVQRTLEELGLQLERAAQLAGTI